MARLKIKSVAIETTANVSLYDSSLTHSNNFRSKVKDASDMKMVESFIAFGN